MLKDMLPNLKAWSGSATHGRIGQSTVTEDFLVHHRNFCTDCSKPCRKACLHCHISFSRVIMLQLNRTYPWEWSVSMVPCHILFLSDGMSYTHIALSSFCNGVNHLLSM